MRTFLIGCIRIYQRLLRTPMALSLVVGSGCRQWPTCSEYAIMAIQEKGVVQGAARAFIRVLHCHPFH